MLKLIVGCFEEEASVQFRMYGSWRFTNDCAVVATVKTTDNNNAIIVSIVEISLRQVEKIQIRVEGMKKVLVE